MFRTISDFVMNHDFVFRDDSLKDYSGLAYSNLFHLQDCGLVSLELNLERQFEWVNREHIVLPHWGGVLMITNSHKPIEKLRIPAIRLTAAGQELFRFVESTLDMKYIRQFSRFLKSKDCEVSHLEGVEQLPDGMLRYSKSTPIEPNSERSGDNTP